MRTLCIAAIILITGFVRASIAQVDSPATSKVPQIIVTFPENIPSETLTIRYLLFGPTGRSVGGGIPSQQGARSYSINAEVERDAALHAKLVVYAPGCQSMHFNFDLNGRDAHERFLCHALATRRIRGFLPPSEIPASLDPKRVELDIYGELEADWICGFFMRGNKGLPLGISGSCLVPSIRLGMVGVLNPTDSGFFELVLPDFASDPSYQSFVASAKSYGWMIITLRDPTTHRTLASIVPTDNSEHRLEVKRDYSDPLVFTTWHPPN